MSGNSLPPLSLRSFWRDLVRCRGATRRVSTATDVFWYARELLLGCILGESVKFCDSILNNPESKNLEKQQLFSIPTCFRQKRCVVWNITVWCKCPLVRKIPFISSFFTQPYRLRRTKASLHMLFHSFLFLASCFQFLTWSWWRSFSTTSIHLVLGHPLGHFPAMLSIITCYSLFWKFLYMSQPAQSLCPYYRRHWEFAYISISSLLVLLSHWSPSFFPPYIFLSTSLFQIYSIPFSLWFIFQTSLP